MLMSIEIFSIKQRRKKKYDKLSERFCHDVCNFSLFREGGIGAQAFLDKKNILPYWIDFKKKQVIFSEISEPNLLSSASFITDAIYENAEKLYFVPFSLFLMLASEINLLKTEIIMGIFTPRSGSTLMCKVISKSKSIFVMSEPICLNLIERHYSLDSEHGKVLFKSTMLFFSHFAHNQGKTALYLKPLAISDFGVVDKLFKIDTKKIITWRGPFETMRSFMEKRPAKIRRIFHILKFMIHRQMWNFQPVDNKQRLIFLFGRNLAPHYRIFVLSWVFPMQYIANLDKRKTVEFRYENFKNFSSHYIVKSLLEYLNRAEEFSEEMLLEFERDSQAGTVVGRHRKYFLSEKEEKKVKAEIEFFINQYTFHLFLSDITKDKS